MWFLLLLILGMLGLVFWMWKRPDPVKRDRANTVQHDLWLENIDARLSYASRLLSEGGQENYDRAYQIYSELSKQHELPQAISQMGLMHLRGLGREASAEQAIGLLERAFRLGGDDAAYQLGMHYQGQAQSEKALYWFRHAAARGHIDAQYQLNAASHQDQDQAEQQHLALLQRNAQSGHAGSQYQLAQHLLFEIAEPNLSEGLHALFQAASQGHLPAARQIYHHYRLGRFLPKNEQSELQYLKTSLLLGGQDLMIDYQQAVLMGKYDLDQRQRVFADLIAQSREQHDAASKTLLGHAYFHGWHVEKNETMALRYWLEAAKTQYPAALNTLAALHYEQYLVSGDASEAFELYSQAQREAPGFVSLMGLGLCHLYGAGTAQDASAAQAMIAEAAMQGWNYAVQNDADMYYALGLFCCMPEYPLPNRDKAQHYLQQAAEMGSADALWTLHQWYAGELMPERASDAQAEAYLTQAADAGHGLAQTKLGIHLLNVLENDASSEQAQQYLQLAAQQGVASAQNRLAELYEQGAAEADMETALQLYHQAAAQADPDAYSNLGRIYLYGQGVERDLQVARAWLQKGSAMQHELSQQLLANIEAYLNQESKF